LLPKAKRFAVLLNPANAPTTEATSKTVKQAASSLELESLFFNASTPADIDAAFVAIARERADALFIAPDGYFAGRGAQFATLAARNRIPASSFSSDMVTAGLLMSYGTSIADVFRQVGVYAGSILKGAKRSSCFAVDTVRIHSQSANCSFAWPRGSPDIARARRRGDRITRAFAAMHESTYGTKRTSDC
jgi:ABC-type uncharacterized transport system substrate-binding protein